MLDHYKACMLGQFEAALWMLHDCIQKCPPEHWSGPGSIIGKYEFWHVVHHTLSCTDGFLSPTEESFQPRPQFHPAGASDLEDEYPSRQFAKHEMIEYVMVVLAKLREAIAAETQESLSGPSGCPWLTFTRGELYLYAMRHVMHHTGQLSALLRRMKLPEQNQPKWGKAGWPQSPELTSVAS
ncbi:MAG: DinB family protein [Phycisphaerales bacterium]|nr:DinB family protein [Phycisphaerales bacterium]